MTITDDTLVRVLYGVRPVIRSVRIADLELFREVTNTEREHMRDALAHGRSWELWSADLFGDGPAYTVEVIA